MAKTVEEYLKLMIGQLVITNADLAAQVSALQEQAEARAAQDIAQGPPSDDPPLSASANLAKAWEGAADRVAPTPQPGRGVKRSNRSIIA